MVRLGFIIGFIALVGVLLSGLAAYRVHDQELTLDGIALARAIDVHASLVQDRLTERELLARVASGLFHAPSVIKADMLQPLRASIYAFKTDFVVASWVARLKPSELEAAQRRIGKAGFPNPMIRNYDDQPLDTQSLTEPIDVVMDVEPRNDQTMGFPGRSLDQHPILGPMFEQAMAAGKAGGFRSGGAAAFGWPDGAGACRAGAAGRRQYAGGFCHIFLRVGATDADQ